MKTILKFITLTMLISCTGKSGINRLQWLQGQWQGNSQEIIFFEKWSIENETILSGKTQAVQNGDTVYNDKMKIELIENKLFFITNVPGSEQPVLYKEKESGETKIIFENNEIAFPTTIIYSFKNDSLHVRMEGKQDNKNVYEEMHFIKK